MHELTPPTNDYVGQDQIADLRARVAELQAQYAAACRVVRKLHDERDATYRDEHAALLRAKALEARVAELEAQNADLEETVDGLEKLCDQRFEEIEALEARCAAMADAR